MDQPSETVGQRVARLRYDKGLSQQELASASGVALPTLKDIERGRTKRPHPKTLRKLAAALSVLPEILAGT